VIAIVCNAIVRGEENVFSETDDGTGGVRCILFTSAS
jgi:hypothetical protein